MKPISDKLRALVIRSADPDPIIARAAQRILVKALEVPLKKGVLKGDLTWFFDVQDFLPGQEVKYPLDIVVPGTERDYRAYVIPNHGRIPERSVSGDYVMVPTYDVGASIDTILKFIRDGRWDIVTRMMEVLEASIILKNNIDAWQTLLTAAKGRGLMVNDDVATAGLFTKRLVGLMRTVMRRNAGGNSTSVNRGKLTDLWVSPEAIQDIPTWDLTQVDDQTRRDIFLRNTDNAGMEFGALFPGLILHDLDEFGVGQEFQLYFTQTLAGSLSASKVELVLGMDLQKNDSFVRPVRDDFVVYEDEHLHRQRRWGMYTWGEGGWAVLDNRRLLPGSF